MGCVCGEEFLERKIVESEVMWLQQSESKYQELLEVADIAIDRPDKTCFSMAAILSLVTDGVGVDGC